MGTAWFSESHLTTIHGADGRDDDLVLAEHLADRLAAAAQGDGDACFDLGVAYSTEGQVLTCDLVEAHKWFNLAALAGHEDAAHCRSEVADEMTAREIAEAQRRARQWLSASAPIRRAA